MPEVEVQRREVGGQCFSIWGHMLVLKLGFSGPCSWMMVAWETAVERFGSILRVPSLKSCKTSSFPLMLVLEASPGGGSDCVEGAPWKYGDRALWR